ncbi:VapA/VapB family virulence-associated protein [Serratia proteamaculans]|uniref:VapA/VapB family virulence-associated protein n=1 Tax=Serratia proteamaculans TaxID=28151 RepID=UPI00217C166C|nr:VapA/VapB family virulence-associated protein [Serratia proteamaculans]CAI0926721.1 Rhodococcus equi virulence-associated protein [Serratia proteamaculans]
MQPNDISETLKTIKEKYINITEKQLSEIAKTLALESTAYGATLDIYDSIFYVGIKINLDDYPWKFDGNAGGFGGFPGTYMSSGDLYSDDLEKLWNNTDSFMFIFTPVYSSIIFFDSSSNSLGSFNGGNLSFAAGTGGGTGSWDE